MSASDRPSCIHVGFSLAALLLGFLLCNWAVSRLSDAEASRVAANAETTKLQAELTGERDLRVKAEGMIAGLRSELKATILPKDVLLKWIEEQPGPAALWQHEPAPMRVIACNPDYAQLIHPDLGPSDVVNRTLNEIHGLADRRNHEDWEGFVKRDRRDHQSATSSTSWGRRVQFNWFHLKESVHLPSGTVAKHWAGGSLCVMRGWDLVFWFPLTEDLVAPTAQVNSRPRRVRVTPRSLTILEARPAGAGPGGGFAWGRNGLALVTGQDTRKWVKEAIPNTGTTEQNPYIIPESWLLDVPSFAKDLDLRLDLITDGQSIEKIDGGLITRSPALPDVESFRTGSRHVDLKFDFRRRSGLGEHDYIFIIRGVLSLDLDPVFDDRAVVAQELQDVRLDDKDKDAGGNQLLRTIARTELSATGAYTIAVVGQVEAYPHGSSQGGASLFVNLNDKKLHQFDSEAIADNRTVVFGGTCEIVASTGGKLSFDLKLSPPPKVPGEGIRVRNLVITLVPR